MAEINGIKTTVALTGIIVQFHLKDVFDTY